jgi:hypothetical protein
MKCVILQPSYIPWRGYFHQILKADIFVFYDDVQYDKHGWRNRNRIKTHQGVIWLSIPVHNKGVTIDHIPINQVEIDWNTPWNRKHWATIQQAYGKAPYFKRYAPLLEEFYSRRYRFLSEFDIDLTLALASALGITGTHFVSSSSLEVPGDTKLTGSKTDRPIKILQKLGVDHYISGPSAKDYIEEDRFNELGITLEYMRYDYPEYPQLYPPYEAQVTILDLLFMAGPEAIDYLCDRETDH